MYSEIEGGLIKGSKQFVKVEVAVYIVTAWFQSDFKKCNHVIIC